MNDRLDHVLATGALDLPEAGRWLVFGLPGHTGAAWPDPERMTVVQGFAPDAVALRAAGIETVPALPDAQEAVDLAVVILPRARLRARLWIAQAVAALAPGGLLVVDGARTDGIDSLWRDCRGRLDGAASESKAHGRVFWGRPAQGFDDWLRAAAALPRVDGLSVAPGVFSADGVDPGSAALAAALPARLPARVADLGAGWGWLSAQILSHEGVEQLDLVEADHLALAAARHNIRDPRARFHWVDALSWSPDAPLDTVVMNPPFHAGRAGDPGLGAGFIRVAADALAPRGELWLVANRHLPYETPLRDRFAEVEELPGPAAFKIFRAARPRRPRR
ncbi:MAG: class I SAM-dependent methyltransferase [Qingshengfaniella sp.]